jgi:hypothetical protein
MSTNTIDLNKQLQFTDGDASIAVTTDVVDLTKPFPHQQLDLAAIKVSATVGDSLKFLGTSGSTQFSLGVGSSAGAGVYISGAAIAKAVGFDSTDVNLSIPDAGATQHYTVLSVGFNAKASGAGSVALAPGASVAFNASLSGDRLFAIIRLYDDSQTTGLDELTEVAQSWKLPSRIDGPSAIPERTWIVSDADGSVALGLKATYGMNFNWVRALKINELSGDLGLKVNLGIDAALGFNYSGTHVIVVAREGDGDVIRVRLFRNSQRGWNFAFDVGATFDSEVPMSDSADDFIKAIIGTHGAQVISDLGIAETWTNTSNNLGTLLAGLGVDKAQALIKDITGVDPATAISDAQAKLKDFLTAWSNLPATASQKLLQFASSNVPALGDIQSLATQISTATPASLGSLLSGKIGAAGFLQTPEGQYLDSLATQGLASLLDPATMQEVQKLASQTVAVLNGTAEKNILTKIQQEIISKLDLQPVLNEATKLSDLDALPFLKSKLAAFLQKEVPALNSDDLNKLRNGIHTLLTQRQAIYTKVKDVLNNQYKFSFAATYQSQTTDMALIDMAFDFTANPNLGSALQDAIAGRFKQILVQAPTPGITLNTAHLTHGIKMQSHAEFNMPHFSWTTDQLAEGNAGFDAIDTVDGRVFTYTASGSDSIDTQRSLSGLRQNSNLTISASLKTPAGGNLRIYNNPGLNYAYSFRQAAQSMKVADFEEQSTRYITTYLSSAFGAQNSPDQWLQAFETAAGAVDGTLSNTLMNLSLSVPASAGAAWLQPITDLDAEGTMLDQVLGALQAIIPFFYLSDLSKFGSPDTVYPLLAFQASLIPSNLDFMDLNQMQGLVPASDSDKLGQTLNYWSARLINTGLDASFYVNTPFIRQKIQNFVLNSINNNVPGNYQLLVGQSIVMCGTVQNARKEITKAMKAAPNDPVAALNAFSQFGVNLAKAFNQQISTLYGGNALRALGTLVFALAGKALAGPAAPLPTANAVLNVYSLNTDPGAFMTADPSAAQIKASANPALVATGAPMTLPAIFAQAVAKKTV